MTKIKILKPAIPTQEDKPTELSLRIRHALERHGFKVYRCNNGATAGGRRANVYDKGLPDFIAHNGSRVLFVEMKDTGDKTVSDAQKFFLEQADNCLSYSTVCWNKKDTDFKDFEEWIRMHK